MDKLELDERVARLERTVSLFRSVFAFAALGVVTLVLIGLARSSGDFYTPPAASIATPAVMEVMPGPGSVAALRRNLVTLQDLSDHGVISHSERDAKKAQLLAKAVVQEDMKADLEAVQELWKSQTVTEPERDALRAKILGIGEPAVSK